MSYPQDSTAAPIPYQGFHDGPRRTLTLTTRKGLSSPRWAHVGIDGSTYVMPWGPATFEVPADRSVRISVHQVTRATGGVAATTLPPSAPAVLEYRAPSHPAFDGEIGPPGVPRARGQVLVGCLLTAAGVLLLLVVLLLVLLLA